MTLFEAPAEHSLTSREMDFLESFAQTTREHMEPTTRESILETAKRCVCGDREQDYGRPESNFRTIASLWIDYLSAKDDALDIRPHDVAAMLALLKIARIATGHAKEDNWVDLAGYAACGGEIEGGNG